jgi:hypothetical protein
MHKVAKTKTKKITRPPNLSKWVFFTAQNDSNFDKLAGGNANYIQQVRLADKPVICIS